MDEFNAFDFYFSSAISIALILWGIIHFFKNLNKWKNRQAVKAELIGYRYRKTRWYDFENTPFSPVITVDNTEIPDNQARRLIGLHPENALIFYKERDREHNYFKIDFLKTHIYNYIALNFGAICFMAGIYFLIQFHKDNAADIDNDFNRYATIFCLALFCIIFMTDWLLDYKTTYFPDKHAPWRLKKPNPLTQEETEKVHSGDIVSFDLARRYSHFLEKKNQWWQAFVLLFAARVFYIF